MYIIPNIDDELKAFAKKIGCIWIGAVEINHKPLCKALCCHTNVLTYINTYGGEHVLGYYFIKNVLNGKFEAILHSIVKKSDKLIDITPFNDREYNIVGIVNTTAIEKNPHHIIQ